MDEDDKFIEKIDKMLGMQLLLFVNNYNRFKYFWIKWEDIWSSRDLTRWRKRS